jgi:very-short-patch-repair endonuclease
MITDIKYVLDKNNILYEEEKEILGRRSDFYLKELNIIIELDGKFHHYATGVSNIRPQSIYRNLLVLSNNIKLI